MIYKCTVSSHGGTVDKYIGFGSRGSVVRIPSSASTFFPMIDGGHSDRICVNETNIRIHKNLRAYTAAVARRVNIFDQSQITFYSFSHCQDGQILAHSDTLRKHTRARIKIVFVKINLYQTKF